MSDCCSTTDACQAGKRFACPVNGRQYLEVPFGTVLLHVSNPWELSLKQQRYYFCDDPQCDVIYFGEDQSCIDKSMLRGKVGIKEVEDSALICYCFGVTKAQARTASVKSFVIEQTKNGTCSCSVTNPSGRCCLKDFPK